MTEQTSQFSSMATGCSLHPRTTSSRRWDPRCSARQHRSTERAFCGPQCAEEKYQKNYGGSHDRFQRDPVYRDSQLKIGWTEEKCIGKDKLAQENHSCRLSYEWYERCRKTLVSHTQQIGQERPDETPIRLPNSSHNHELSPPRIRRRTTRTNPFSSVPEVALVFFFQYLMVEMGIKNWWSSKLF